MTDSTTFNITKSLNWKSINEAITADLEKYAPDEFGAKSDMIIEKEN
jgi:hypothetical protein